MTLQPTQVAPGDFTRLDVRVPNERDNVGTTKVETDETLTFNAFQTYADGEVMGWIGPPDSDEPAPQVVLTSTATTAEPADAATESEDDDGAPVWLAVVALALGALGLLAGGAALMRSRG